MTRINQYLNVIPTPMYFEYTRGTPLSISKVFCRARIGAPLGRALELLEKEQDFVYSDASEADLIITDRPLEFFPESELDFFSKKYADKQGYLLKKETGKPIVIAAKSTTGCAYGIMTLLQLLGKEIAEIMIKDWPDFKRRSNMWTAWAESGVWSYDFGDGPEAMKERIVRKLDLNFRYKINLIYVDGFGLDTERFPEYAEIMRFANDEARKRDIHLYSGAYGMSYGQAGYQGYFGKVYKNRRCYPDGETYECIASVDAKLIFQRKLKLVAREYGTCLSNDALFELKAEEFENYVKKTHCGGLYIHNMDSYEIYPEIWNARCEQCRRKWPNDDLYAEDGAAGAFAWYFGKLANRLAQVKDGDYDASGDLEITLVSPAYLYAVHTSDYDYDVGMKFWSAVTRYMDADNVSICFRENFYYHDKPVRRAEALTENHFDKDTMVINFCGADGFYDDKLFTTTAVLNDIMKGFDGFITANGNAFQEPLQVFNAEYQWNCDHSGFYNLEDRPGDQEAFMALYQSALDSGFRPEEIYGEGGMIDVICEKLYGSEIGSEMARIYKVCGNNGEPPVAAAACVDIYSEFGRAFLPMRWDNEEITEEIIRQYSERFSRCSMASKTAADIMTKVLADFDGDGEIRKDLIWFGECLTMGSRLTELLDLYMGVYAEVDRHFAGGTTLRAGIEEEIERIREGAKEFVGRFVDRPGVKPMDKLGGSMVRRAFMADFLEYNAELMLASIRTGKRIPDNRRPLAKKTWW